MALDRSSFETSEVTSEKFEKLLTPTKKAKPTVSIGGEFNFSSSALDKKKQTPPAKEIKLEESTIRPPEPSGMAPTPGKRGRPVTIKDKRYKVNRPKMISQALESKLSIVQDYIEEFRAETGRITFEKYIDTLLESYIKQRLGVSKEEHLRNEIDEKFNQL